jgi:hypothetical protein
VDAATPPIAHSATARARSGPSRKARLISAIDAGINTAAAEPCTNRAATSQPRLGASPQPADAAAKTPAPTVNAREAPTRSDSAPAHSSRPAKARV